jgi:hypothetical protein
MTHEDKQAKMMTPVLWYQSRKWLSAKFPVHTPRGEVLASEEFVRDLPF